MNKHVLLGLLTAISGCVGIDDNGRGVHDFFGDEPSGSNPLDWGKSDDPAPLPPRDQPPTEKPSNACGENEVHVFGIYETRSDHTTTGDAVVRLERPGLQTIVLSAYEPTRWKIELANGARLSAIHLVGYHNQTVTPPHEDITITTDTYDQTDGGACGYSYPYNGEGCDTNKLMALAAARSKHDVTSFHGCYQASRLTLDKDANATGCEASYHVAEMHNTCVDIR